MKRLIILIAALMLITTGCHKDESEPEHKLVVYHGNGGLTANGESSVKDFYWGRTSVYAEENMFTYGGYNFKGWSLSPGGTVYCQPGDRIGKNWDWSWSDTDLYAVWNDGETIFMCNGSKQLSSDKTYRFYDSGGPTENYSEYENYTYTFKVPSGKRVKIVFNDFRTEKDYDELRIDGSVYSGSSNPGTLYSSGNVMLLKWHSNGAYNYSGWSATVTVVN